MSAMPWSVHARLKTGFVWIAAVGALVLAVFLFLDFGLYHEEVRAAYGNLGLLHEVIDHVVFPIAVTLVPLVLAVRWLLERSLAPLVAASEEVHQAAGQDRGFRVDGRAMPLEALPFVQAINALLARLDDSARRQEGFAADVAHELKSGLSAVMLELEAMNTERSRRAIKDIRAMNRLTEQLLLLARLDAYAAAPEPLGRLDLVRCAQDAARLMAPMAMTKRVQLAIDLDEPGEILGRHEAITAALRNLIENAVRMTPPGQEVCVTCGPGARVSVADGGPGIPPETLPDLCSRFRRAENASEAGAGLGLSIVARVVELHHGRIESDPDIPALSLVFPPAFEPDR